jgi:hypothetical protein
MSKEVLDHTVAEMKASPCFAFHLDKSTDVASCEQLLVYTQYIKGESLKEKFLFSESLTTTANGEDVFRTLQNFFIDKVLRWTKLVDMCTDTALSVMEIHSGFKAHIKQVTLHAKFTHCELHR